VTIFFEKREFKMTLPHKAMWLLSCCLWTGTQAFGITEISDFGAKRNDQSPLVATDLSFLRSEPSRKQKQKVESDGIKTKGDATILESAVIDVMRFCSGLSLWQYPGNYEKVMSRTTSRGASILQWPPKHGTDKIVPLSPMRYSAWRIVSNSELSVRVDYGDMGPNGGLKWPPIVTWRMVFLKQDGTWKFDGYVQ
jgi:hypothetical protein